MNTNWNPLPPTGQPTSADAVFVNNGGTAQISGTAAANSLTIGGTALGGTVQLSGGVLNVTNAVTIGTGGTLFLSGGRLTATGIQDNGSLVFTLGYSAPITTTGSGSVTLTGTGTTTFTADNTYAGGTTINGQTLQLGNGETTGSITGDVVDNGTLTFNRSNNVSFDGAISGAGNLVKLGGGFLLLGGPNTYTGTTIVNAGALVADRTDSFSASSAFTINAGATLDLFGSNNTVGSLSGSGVVINSGGVDVPTNATLSVGADNTSTTFSGTLKDGPFSTLALTKVGTGTLTLTGPNTYSGGTSLNGGILAVNNDGNLGTGPLSFDGGTLEALTGGGINSSKAITLNAGGGTFLADAGTTSTLSGAIADPLEGFGGPLTKSGAGTLILSGANTYSGGTNINGGILAVNNDGNLGTGPLSFNSGTLEALGPINSSKAITLNAGGGTFLADSGTSIRRVRRTASARTQRLLSTQVPRWI